MDERDVRIIELELEIPFVDKSIDKNDKKPVTNLSTNLGRQ